jgi:hypothetical protein
VLRPLVLEVHELFTDFLPGMTEASTAAREKGKETANEKGHGKERDQGKG